MWLPSWQNVYESMQRSARGVRAGVGGGGSEGGLTHGTRQRCGGDGTTPTRHLGERCYRRMHVPGNICLPLGRAREHLSYRAPSVFCAPPSYFVGCPALELATSIAADFWYARGGDAENTLRPLLTHTHLNVIAKFAQLKEWLPSGPLMEAAMVSISLAALSPGENLEHPRESEQVAGNSRPQQHQGIIPRGRRSPRRHRGEAGLARAGHPVSGRLIVSVMRGYSA